MQTIICRMDKQESPMYYRGNYSQYPGINHNGKEYEKKNINESACCTAEMSTAFYINYISIKSFKKQALPRWPSG